MRKGKPEIGELVVCKITKIYPNSVYAKLLEYDLSGMIHVSEVAKKWVRNIKEFVKENQYVVCKVMGVEGSDISLSLKRVWHEDSKRRLIEFKKEKKAEKMLEIVAKSMKKNINQAYNEIGFDLQENFGSLQKAFYIAFKNPELFKRKLDSKKWAEAIIQFVKKNYVEKIYKAKAELKLICYKPNGVEIIKKILSKLPEGIEVKYISAPKYLVVGTGKNYKELESKIKEICQGFVKEIEKNNGEGSFEIIKK